ncbi:hypothetical protein [Blastopirellula marina]|uniref:Imelysin-like domain-containing protein n=1 Tax=Blastopirellula marina TaxID=124 RepID=A0A2S8GKP0_9BACT|nr:hypothetical protein [Blastopirellula marina]PQO44992.1 hypothetical protein C5Y93_15775 [Blastopirellula marina]
MSFLGLRSLCVLLVCIPTLSLADSLPGPCAFAAYAAAKPDLAATVDPLADFVNANWAQKAIRDCLEPSRTKPVGDSQFAVNVAEDHHGGKGLNELRHELDLAWQQVSELFWESPENPESFRLARLDLWMTSLSSRSLAGWLPSAEPALEVVTQQELAEIARFIVDEEYAAAVAARPIIAEAIQDDCPPMPPVVERITLDSESIAPEVVEEVASLLEDEEAPLTDEEIAYLHSGPLDFVNSLDPYGYTEYNDYLDEEHAAAPKTEQGAAWTVVIAKQIAGLANSSGEGIRWFATFDLSGPIEAARQAHQEREIRRYRTAERQILERWDAIIDGFEVLR